ncbi:MAG: amino acid racemase [Clostridia bacterium]|nr:amino acid racemase [Clostridia bacterium]
MPKRSIGIIGGMGPMATLDLFHKVLKSTDAHNDAEHIRIYIDCHTGIPDRTKAILTGGESPVPHILESAEKLAAMGADFLLIPCNTSHYFYEEIANGSSIPVMHMIRETAQALKKDGVACVGLLATDGTVQAGVYQKELERAGIQTVCPDAEGQREVMRLIYDGVKAGANSFDTTLLKQELQRMREMGAQRIVLGCTELPIAFQNYGIPSNDTVDPTDILAKAAVAAAGYPVKR